MNNITLNIKNPNSPYKRNMALTKPRILGETIYSPLSGRAIAEEGEIISNGLIMDIQVYGIEKIKIRNDPGGINPVF